MARASPSIVVAVVLLAQQALALRKPPARPAPRRGVRHLFESKLPTTRGRLLACSDELKFINSRLA